MYKIFHHVNIAPFTQCIFFFTVVFEIPHNFDVKCSSKVVAKSVAFLSERTVFESVSPFLTAMWLRRFLKQLI